MTGSRVLFAVAADGLLFKPIATVHPKFQTPSVAIALSAGLGVLFVLLGTFEQLADTFVTAIVPFYALAVGSVFIFRRRAGYNPSFRVPGYPVVPAIFILATILLLGNAIIDPSSRVPTLAVLGVILLGIPIFYVSKGRSGDGRYNTASVRFVASGDTFSSVAVPEATLWPRLFHKEFMLKTRLLVPSPHHGAVTGASLVFRPGRHDGAFIGLSRPTVTRRGCQSR